MKISKEKIENLKKLVNEDGVIAALAIDQRGSMEKMIAKANQTLNNIEGISEFKRQVSKELTQYSSSILLDPIYGKTAIEAKDKNVGLILSYEQTGYDEYEEGRFPRLIDFMSGLKAREMGANGLKVLLYYDKDEDEKINEIKKAWVERVGYEAEGLGLPYFLEIVTYDHTLDSEKDEKYAKVRPEKVIDAMKEFDNPRYKVDVLKVETPVNMNYVEGYSENFVYTKDQAKEYFKAQTQATKIPYIFLSGGVSADLFKEALKLAKEAGANFNGVLCGRATWKDCVDIYGKDKEESQKWLKETGKENIQNLNQVLKETAESIFDKIEE